MKTKTSIIAWPWVQDLFDINGFSENSALCSSEEMYSEYGDSSYAVSDQWLSIIDPQTLIRALDGLISQGPELDFNTLPMLCDSDMLYI